MSAEEIRELVKKILERGYPAERRELCILFRHYVSEGITVQVLMLIPEHAIRQCVTVMMYRHLKSATPYTNSLRKEIGKVTGVSPNTVLLWFKESLRK